MLGVLAAALRLLVRPSTWRTIGGAFDFLLSNEIYTYASAIAFNALIALFPGAIVALTLVSVWGGPAMHDEMLKAIVEFIPANQAFFAREISAATHNFSGMTLVSLGVLLFGAVGVFVPVELALNYVWKEAKPRHWAISQAISFLLLAGLLLLAVVPVYLALQFEHGLDAVFGWMQASWLGGLVPSTFFTWINDTLAWLFLKVVSLPFSVIAFAVVYAVLPQKRLTLEQVLPAALFAGLGFEVGRHLYTLCLPLLDFHEMYGAFSVSVTFVTWALFASMLMLMGAWLTAQDLLPRMRWPLRRSIPGAPSGDGGNSSGGPVAPLRGDR